MNRNNLLQRPIDVLSVSLPKSFDISQVIFIIDASSNSVLTVPLREKVPYPG